VARWGELHDLAVAVRGADWQQPAAVRDRLDYLDAIHAFVLTRIDEALREWEERRPRRRAASAPHAPRRQQTTAPRPQRPARVGGKRG